MVPKRMSYLAIWVIEEADTVLFQGYRVHICFPGLGGQRHRDGSLKQRCWGEGSYWAHYYRDKSWSPSPFPPGKPLLAQLCIT